MKIKAKNGSNFNIWVCGGIIFLVERKQSIFDRFINSIVDFE